MTAPSIPLENTSITGSPALAGHNPWAAEHPLFSPVGTENTANTAASLNLTDAGPRSVSGGQPNNYMEALATAAPAPEGTMEVPPIFNGGGAAPEIPAPVQQAIASGAPIRFSSPADDQQAGRQPDYFFTPDGQMVPNPKATPSPDGSITIEIQNQDAKNNQSLRDAITHESDMQRQAAQEMIRLYEKAHPGQPAPSWMRDLANAKPNLPDFIPFPPAANAPPTAPPENGFVNRGVSSAGSGRGGSGGSGDGGFAGNGGFDNKGYFQGNGSSGDGTVSTGGTNSQGQPLGPGEQVQAKQLYDYFMQNGFTAAQASGILGNIQTESSFRTDAHNAREGAIGLCQWEGNRRVELERFAASEGKPVTDWHVQADFIMHELKTTESRAYADLKQTTTPAEAAHVFQREYERSASIGDRMANANNISRQMQNA